MRQLSLLKKFSLLLFIALALFGVSLGKIITAAMQDNMIKRANEMAANFLTYEIKNKLQLEDLTTIKTGREYEETSLKISDLHLGPDVIRLKIWNDEYYIVWSTDQDEVGGQSLGHHELEHVFEGQIISEISSEHHLSEKYAYANVEQVSEVMELYIPVRFGPQNDVGLVFEVYTKIDSLMADIVHHNKIIWSSTILGSAILYLLLFGLFLRASRQIDQKSTEIKLSEERFRSLIHSAQDGIISADRNVKIILINQAAEKIFGYLSSEAQELLFTNLFSYEDDNDFQRELNCYFESGECLSEGKTFELTGLHKNGKLIPIEVSLSVSGDNENKVLTGMIRDITGRKKAEDQHEKLQSQLIQMQKMETVGRLAGGIAHDFNNILSAIIGYSELALNDLPKNSQTFEDVTTIKESGEKAAVLTGQLLAFSRKQVLKMQSLELNSAIEKMAKMLHRLIGEDIALDLHLSPNIGNINGDPGQIEQIILNLAVNARDAMPNGGQLIIETSEVELGNDYVDQHPDAKLGKHVLLAVTDTGLGMTAEVREQIFDPFFTTKELGKGTGLGLATVYGIVKQHESQIYVYSEVDKGTTFKIFLPVIEDAVDGKADQQVEAIPLGKDTFLIAEDDQIIQRMIRSYLEPLGYNLLIASDGQEAINLSKAYEGDIHILLTDVIMPNMNGQELADAIQEMRPDMQIIFMSGYTDDVISHHGVLEPGVNFIQKPITPSRLAKVLREVLKKS
jgi:PAS domain S-box-containing protein